MTSNSCVVSCPDGTYGNATSNLCLICDYYTYLNTCIPTCPQNTTPVLIPKSICQYCGNNCSIINYVIMSVLAKL
jgi:hypothetical protein